jgi:hypothetical protein
MNKKPAVLKEFKRVKPDRISSLKVGDLVKYSIDKELRHGGMLHKNMFPKYLVLANYQKKVTWSVQLTEPTLILYVKPKEVLDAERKAMKQMYQEAKLAGC